LLFLTQDLQSDVMDNITATKWMRQLCLGNGTLSTMVTRFLTDRVDNHIMRTSRLEDAMKFMRPIILMGNDAYHVEAKEVTRTHL